MDGSLKFRVESTDENVVVTLPGTKCMAKYRRATHLPWLTLFHARGDESSPIHEVHFHARAWQLANEKAKELGWIV